MSQARVPLTKVLLSDIKVDGRETQSRVMVDAEKVDEYREELTLTGDRMFTRHDPVVLFHDGTKFWIGDGWHRILAAIRVGFTHIPAEVQPGGKVEVQFYAAGAHTTHGLQRSNADKRKAVRLLLAHPLAKGWTHRQIAEHCHVSHTFVNLLSAEAAGNVSNDSLHAGKSQSA